MEADTEVDTEAKSVAATEVVVATVTMDMVEVLATEVAATPAMAMVEEEAHTAEATVRRLQADTAVVHSLLLLPQQLPLHNLPPLQP